MKTIAISPETMQARIARFAEVRPSATYDLLTGAGVGFDAGVEVER